MDSSALLCSPRCSNWEFHARITRALELGLLPSLSRARQSLHQIITAPQSFLRFGPKGVYGDPIGFNPYNRPSNPLGESLCLRAKFCFRGVEKRFCTKDAAKALQDIRRITFRYATEDFIVKGDSLHSADRARLPRRNWSRITGFEMKLIAHISSSTFATAVLAVDLTQI